MTSADRDNPVPGDGSPTPPDPFTGEEGVFSRRFRWITIGMFLLAMLAAFVVMAVRTVMPIVGRELHADGLYTFAFGGPLAVSVVGMVLAGVWSDRGNPRHALVAAVALLTVGLTVTGCAPDMFFFVIGRLLHGLGGGAITVALYAIVARAYPPALHARVFAAFDAAWLLPSLVGPAVAGILAEAIGWRWVFLGAVALVVVAMLMIVPALGSVGEARESAAQSRGGLIGRIVWPALAAASVLALTLAAEAEDIVLWIVPVVATVVAFIAVRPLLPAGTLRVRRGLPSVVLMRGLVTGTFFAAEVYVPLLLVTRYEASAATAGLALTAAGVTWSVASWAQGRFPRITHRLAAQAGAFGLTLAVGLLLMTAVTGALPVVVLIGWAFAGAGMGLIYPRLAVLTLEYSSPHNQGFNSSAVSIAESIGSAIVLTATSIVFSAFGGTASDSSFAAVFALTAVFCALAWVWGPRMLPARGSRSPLDSRSAT